MLFVTKYHSAFFAGLFELFSPSFFVCPGTMNFLIDFTIRIICRWMFVGMMPAGGGDAGAGSNDGNGRKQNGVNDAPSSLGPSASAVESQVSVSIAFM